MTCVAQGPGIVARMACDPAADKGLRAVDAAHLIESATTRIGIRKNAWLRSYVHTFMELFAPHLSRRMVQSALAGEEPVFAELDEGEASTLRAAVNLRRPCLILMDEKAGRAIAQELGFAVTGTAGIILAAKRRRLIPAARPVFEQLLENDFRLSAELIRAVLTESGEA